MPSSHRSEAFGTVLIEAMTTGRPVISTELGTGTSFINIHESTGLVVPPRDPISLAMAIKRLLGDETLQKKFGENGNERAKGFSVEQLNKSIMEVYYEVLS